MWIPSLFPKQNKNIFSLFRKRPSFVLRKSSLHHKTIHRNNPPSLYLTARLLISMNIKSTGTLLSTVDRHQFHERYFTVVSSDEEMPVAKPGSVSWSNHNLEIYSTQKSCCTNQLIYRHSINTARDLSSSELIVPSWYLILNSATKKEKKTSSTDRDWYSSYVILWHYSKQWWRVQRSR